MIEARKRHFEDLLLKKNHYLNVQLAEDKQREMNQRKRLENKTNLTMSKLTTMGMNRQLKEQTKKEFSEAKSVEDQRRMALKEQQKIQKLQELINRNKIRQDYQDELENRKYQVGSAYSIRQAREHIKKDIYKTRIQQLEEKEMQLIDQLKETTNRQRHAYQNLDQVVSQGYDYYLQSFAEKRQIQERKAKVKSVIDGQRFQSLDASKDANESGLLNPLNIEVITEKAPKNTKLRQLQVQSQVQLPTSNS